MLLIFDCDGVLVDSERIALDVLSAMMGEYGHPMDVAACQDVFMGKHAADILREIETRLGRALPPTEAGMMRGRMLARLEHELRPVDGVADMLRCLEGPRCVASSSDRARIKLTLTWTGLDGFFGDALFSGFDVPRGKPAPDLFLHAAKAMGVAPRDCVVIEDSPAGVAAAVAAQMRPIGFVGGSHTDPSHEARLRAAGAATVIHSMADLPEAVAAADAV